MIERTLILLKPDAFQRNLDKELIIRMFHESSVRGYKVALLCKFLNIPKATIEKHYEEHKDKNFYNDLINFMMEGYITAIIIEGSGSVDGMRNIAMKIREQYGVEKERNLIHSSDSIESGDRECRNIFGNMIDALEEK